MSLSPKKRNRLRGHTSIEQSRARRDLAERPKYQIPRKSRKAEKNIKATRGGRGRTWRRRGWRHAGVSARKGEKKKRNTFVSQTAILFDAVKAFFMQKAGGR